MDYKIASAHEKDLNWVKHVLEIKVIRLMSEGYKPQGGVSIATEMHESTAWYTACQAMIKEK